MADLALERDAKAQVMADLALERDAKAQVMADLALERDANAEATAALAGKDNDLQMMCGERKNLLAYI
jgi:hypothetical protein